MPQTVEVIVYPDGHIEPLDVVHPDTPRRAFLMILDEPPRPNAFPPAADECARVRAILAAAGLVEDVAFQHGTGTLLDDA